MFTDIFQSFTTLKGTYFYQMSCKSDDFSAKTSLKEPFFVRFNRGMKNNASIERPCMYKNKHKFVQKVAKKNILLISFECCTLNGGLKD